jgi:CheY-like chemotaxis protein
VAGTILIIDDHEDTRKIYGEILRHARFQVLEAAEAATGLQLLRSERPQLVVLDVFLPGTSGFELLAEMRGDESMRHVPVICVSANVFAEAMERAYALGCNLYLTKPLPPRELLHHVQGVIGIAAPPARELDATS